MRASMHWPVRACLGVLLLQAAGLYADSPAPQKKDPNWGPGNVILVPPVTTKVHILLIFDTNADDLTKVMAVNKDQLKGVVTDDMKEGTYDLTVLEGADVTADNVLNYYRDLSVGSTESVFCYYAGHGGYDETGGLFFDLKAKGTGSLVRSKLLDAMKAKNGRLTALLSDCCANSSTIKPPPLKVEAAPPGGPVGDMRWLSHWVRELLLRTTGVVDINSCDSKTRQRSFAVLIPTDDGKNVTKGGLFTSNIVSILSQPLCASTSLKDVTWQAFYDQVKQGTQDDYQALLKGNPDAAREPEVVRQADQTPEALQLDEKHDEVRIAGEVKVWRLGLRAVNNNGDGVRVGQVLPGTPAQRVGFEVGDVLLAIDGKTLKSEDDFKECMDSCFTGHIKVVVRNVRTKQEFTLPDLALDRLPK